MSDAPELRSPRVFAPDDPALVAEPEPADPPPAAPDVAAADAAVAVSRPTLADLADRGLRWGSILASAILGAAVLGAMTWFYRLVSLALARDDWLGWLVTGCLGLAAFAFAMIVLREIVGFTRLSRLNRLRRAVSEAIDGRDRAREKQAALRVAALYAGRPETAWTLRRFRDYARDVHDPGELLALADREIVARLDVTARQVVTRSAKRVATVTALSPLAAISVGYVLVENLRLLRLLATIYGGRPGLIGVLRLARLVVGHMIATGGLALTDDLLGQFLGQDLLRRLSRRLGEGAFNGALTARIGVAAIELIRPLPFLAVRAPRARDILADALKPLFASKDGDKSAAR
ncbi:MAG: TIGR01620 family protein [Hyphomicrobiaceae bacterium]|nr:TIGR01620 family protein [Hyphomicrobiaceae bacterium]